MSPTLHGKRNKKKSARERQRKRPKFLFNRACNFMSLPPWDFQPHVAGVMWKSSGSEAAPKKEFEYFVAFWQKGNMLRNAVVSHNLLDLPCVYFSFSLSIFLSLLRVPTSTRRLCDATVSTSGKEISSHLVSHFDGRWYRVTSPSSLTPQFRLFSTSQTRGFFLTWTKKIPYVYKAPLIDLELEGFFLFIYTHMGYVRKMVYGFHDSEYFLKWTMKNIRLLYSQRFFYQCHD